MSTSAHCAEAEKMERALFYVAITRAKRGVLITAHGKGSPWIAERERQVNK